MWARDSCSTSDTGMYPPPNLDSVPSMSISVMQYAHTRTDANAATTDTGM